MIVDTNSITASTVPYICVVQIATASQTRWLLVVAVQLAYHDLC